LAFWRGVGGILAGVEFGVNSVSRMILDARRSGAQAGSDVGEWSLTACWSSNEAICPLSWGKS